MIWSGGSLSFVMMKGWSLLFSLSEKGGGGFTPFLQLSLGSHSVFVTQFIIEFLISSPRPPLPDNFWQSL